VLETLLTLGSRPVNLYALPHLSRLQADPGGLRRAVRACMRLSALATVPLMLIMAACAKQLTDALGSHWAPATDVLRLLAIVGVTKALIVFEGSVLFAVGRPRTRAVVIWSLAAVSIAGFVAAALILRGTPTHHEVVGMALSRVVLFVAVFMPVTVIVIARVTGSRALPLFAELIRPTIAGLAAVGVVAGMDHLGLLEGPPLLDLVAAAIVASAVCGGVLVALDRQVRGQIVQMIRKLRARPRGGGRLAASAPD
jgi:O-antigen/teichoic acid export membrane protein